MNVYVSEAAFDSLHKIAAFLEKRWSTKVKAKFFEELENAKITIAKNPKAFPVSPNLGYRKYLINKRTILLYGVVEKHVHIVQAFDARVNYEDKQKWKQ